MNPHMLHQITIWLSAGIALITALAYFSKAKQVIANFRSLGYPDYLPLILGV